MTLNFKAKQKTCVYFLKLIETHHQPVRGECIFFNCIKKNSNQCTFASRLKARLVRYDINKILTYYSDFTLIFSIHVFRKARLSSIDCWRSVEACCPAPKAGSMFFATSVVTLCTRCLHVQGWLKGTNNGVF